MSTFPDQFRLNGRTALVTGGASGIGEATCRALTGAGASAIIADVDRPRAEALHGRADVWLARHFYACAGAKSTLVESAAS